MTSLQEMIYSNDYADLIVPIPSSDDTFLETNSALGPQLFGGRMGMIHLLRSGRTNWETLSYSFFPKLFTLQDTTSLETSGILRFQAQPNLGYTGENVLLGFLDTGIDYTLDIFRFSDGRTKLISIWDQTISSDSPPFDTGYGTEYTEEQINQALTSDDPISFVPSLDTNGHGTFLAGIAAGSADTSAQFIGAAPGSRIAMVKLKPAKQYLRDYYLISDTAEAYQETDLMMALRYLLSLSISKNLPLVLCIGLGSNQGDHNGTSPLERLLDYFVDYQGCFCAVAAGNEAGRGHHFFYDFAQSSAADTTAELLVDNETTGFSMEIWADVPTLYGISITSPLGEKIPTIYPRQGSINTYPFLTERTILELRYEIAESASGSLLIQIRFRNPTAGIWRLQLISFDANPLGGCHMWLPITGFISPGTVFLNPDPDTTLTAPSSARSVITVSTYSAYTGSLYIYSGRGFTRDHSIKPDLAAPGVDVYGPAIRPANDLPSLNPYIRRSGSSAACAITAGAMALFINWSTNRNIAFSGLTNNRAVKSYLTRSAMRAPTRTYPNPEWGYGTLDLYGIFQSLL